jgi:hypothetical protein
MEWEVTDGFCGGKKAWFSAGNLSLGVASSSLYATRARKSKNGWSFRSLFFFSFSLFMLPNRSSIV